MLCGTAFQVEDRGPSSPDRARKDKIDGDRVTFCVRRPGEDRRPGEFKDVEDESFMFDIKRVNPAR
jgi:hypothetical protein